MGQPVVPLRIVRPRAIEILDQTRLPHSSLFLTLEDLPSVCEAISTLRIRGAPLLGLTGACGLAIAARTDASDSALRAAAETLIATRPTAVDLAACVRASLEGALIEPDEARRVDLLWDFAEALAEARRREDTAIAEFGAMLLPQHASVLTHCNTGALATGGVGTALGVIQRAFELGRLQRCYATETRPLLQGARLTAWELRQLDIPATLLPDTAAASLIASGRVDAIITGADRIAANGDTANKVGTYGLAAVAARHNVPFYIAAPRTTIDLACPDGAAIPIEFRAASEVGGFGDTRWAPDGLDAYNPAFDVTPAGLIAAIVTECGVAHSPYGESLPVLMQRPQLA
jgi:methylthioribose-1-phosphate isomerase